MNKAIVVLSSTILILASACKESVPAAPSNTTPNESSLPVLSKSPLMERETELIVRQLFLAYIQQIDADYSAVANTLESLSQRVDTLLNTPNSNTLAAARSAWIDANASFEQTTLHRYLAFAIAQEETALELFSLQYQMNQWPIVAGYLDSVSGYEKAGIVHDVNVILSAQGLREQHGLFDTAEATLGFHVIEFLLWGQPGSSATRLPKDFLIITQLSEAQRDSGMELSQLGNNRRRNFLELTTQLLNEDFIGSLLVWEEVKTQTLTSLTDRAPASLLSALLESSIAMLTEELLVKSLYPLLNGDVSDALQAPYAQASDKVVAAQLQSIESLILEVPNSDGLTLDRVLLELSDSFEELFYQNLDASKACLVLLYSNIGASDSSGIEPRTEFEIVECINLLTNLVDQLEQVNILLPAFQTPV